MKITGHVNKVGDAIGVDEVCEMWENQYNNLHNKLESNKSMQDYYDHTTAMQRSHGYCQRVVFRLSVVRDTSEL